MRSRERVLQYVVFDESQFGRPGSVRLDLRRVGCTGLSYRPERTPSLIRARIETIRHIACMEEVHRCSSRSVAYLKDARLGQSLEMREARRRSTYHVSLHPPQGACRHLCVRFLLNESNGAIAADSGKENRPNHSSLAAKFLLWRSVRTQYKMLPRSAACPGT